MMPFLSIITATYNNEKTLEKTFLSILNQKKSNLEYIVIDGKSSDKTLEIIKKYELLFIEKNIKLKWISELDTGIYNAWNKGVKLASGDWISFLGSDDVYIGNALEKYYNLIIKNPDKDFIYSKVKLVKGSLLVREINTQWQWQKFKKNMDLAHVGAFHNRKYFDKYGFFNEKYKIAGDYEMLLRAKSDLKTIFLDEFTVKMEDGGISNNNISRAFKEARKAKIKTGGIGLFDANLEYIYMYFKYFGGKLLRKLKLK